MYTNAEKRQCIQRELGLRRQVYMRRIADKRMTKSQADREIGMMEEIAEDYRALTDREQLPLAGGQ